MGLPLVSIVTGYYNRKEGLKESVQSILDQDYPNFEYLIFDDVSTDGTYEALLEFKDPRLKVIRHTSNIGFTNGMVEAIKMAKGEFIAVHGAGDISMPTRISKQAKVLMEEPNISIAGCFINNIGSDNDVRKTRKKELYERSELFNHSPLSHGEVMYRKDQYFAAGGYRAVFRFAQDADLWLRLSKFGSVKIVQEMLYRRVTQPEGVSFNPKKVLTQSMFSFLARDVNKLTDEEQKAVLDKCLTEGVESVINKNDERLKKLLFKRFHLLVHYHNHETMRIFVTNAVGGYKIYYAFLNNIFRFKPLKRLAYTFQFKVYKKLKSIINTK